MTETTVPTDAALPRVPLPTPEDSRDRLLEWCAPLVTPAELDATRAALDEFLAGPAADLQRELAAYDASGVESWLDDFWDHRYLGRRDRIALNANFFFLFRDAGPADQIDRAAALASAAAELHLRIAAGTVPPVVRRGRPETSAQLPYLFSTTRIPGEVQDTVRRVDGARHAMVLRRGGWHRIDVVTPDGRPHSPSALATALRPLLDAPEGEGAGRLTTGARAEWAGDRAQLPAAALEAIESALFCLCLEEQEPTGDLALCDALLHGNAENRWFDKALSIIVFPGGRAGVNIEHCRLDGTTVLQAVDAILTAAPTGSDDVPAAEPVPVPMSDELRRRADRAGREFEAYAAATATRTLAFADFGATAIKKLGVSPDAFVQAAYQLAHRRAKGLTGATYESIATRQYRGGRTEAMRVVTPEMVAFADAATDLAATTATRRAAFDAAVAAHGTRARDCQEGRAPEQHLWELARRAVARTGEEPAFLRSPGWRILRDDYLSTSSAPSETIDYFGFGSTSDRCIGVAYVLLPERFHLYLSTPEAVADRMEVFAAELERAVAELRELAT